MGTWRTLHPRRILYAPGVISVHGGVSPGEPRTRALRFGVECLFDLPTAGPKITADCTTQGNLLKGQSS